MDNIFKSMQVTRARNKEEYPFHVEVFWDEHGTDEDGEDVQRIEGYGFDEEAEFKRFLVELIEDVGIEKFIVEYHPQ